MPRGQDPNPKRAKHEERCIIPLTSKKVSLNVRPQRIKVRKYYKNEKRAWRSLEEMDVDPAKIWDDSLIKR